MPAPTFPSQETICREWAAWCAENGLPNQSMDEVAVDATPKQREQIAQMQARWEAAVVYTRGSTDAEGLAAVLHDRDVVEYLDTVLADFDAVFDASCPSGSFMVCGNRFPFTVCATPGWNGDDTLDVQVTDAEGVLLNDGESGSYPLSEFTVSEYARLLYGIVAAAIASNGVRTN